MTSSVSSELISYRTRQQTRAGKQSYKFVNMTHTMY